MRCLDSITDSMDMNLRKFWEIVKNRGVWCPTVQEIRESDTAWQLNSNNNVTELYKELGNVLCISQYNCAAQFESYKHTEFSSDAK